jgi:hypothetical protein
MKPRVAAWKRRTHRPLHDSAAFQLQHSFRTLRKLGFSELSIPSHEDGLDVVLTPSAFLFENASGVLGIAQGCAKNFEDLENGFGVSVDALLARVEIGGLNTE